LLVADASKLRPHVKIPNKKGGRRFRPPPDACKSNQNL
jgi:hypothetical protein